MNGQDVTAIGGEFRRLTTEEIGWIVRRAREERGTKRTALAADAKLTEKTLERAEAGVGLSEKSYRQIASALGMYEDAFIREQYVPSEEEAVELSQRHDEELKRNFRAIPVEPIRELRQVLELCGAEALITQDAAVAEEHLQAVAALKDYLRDCADLSDISEQDRVKVAREALDEIRVIERLGYVVKVGVTTSYRLPNGMRFNYGLLAFFRRPASPREKTPEKLWLPRRMSVI